MNSKKTVLIIPIALLCLAAAACSAEENVNAVPPSSAGVDPMLQKLEVHQLTGPTTLALGGVRISPAPEGSAVKLSATDALAVASANGMIVEDVKRSGADAYLVTFSDDRQGTLDPETSEVKHGIQNRTAWIIRVERISSFQSGPPPQQAGATMQTLPPRSHEMFVAVDVTDRSILKAWEEPAAGVSLPK